MKYKPNKRDKARVIVQALYNADTLPSVDHKLVKQKARLSVSTLEWEYKTAVKVLQGKLSN
jgi:hypothetical protein